MKRFLVILLMASVFGAVGCWPGSRKITPLERAEAANMVSEAQFAMNLKEWPRAEGLLVKAAKICPDTGDYWLALGVTRMRRNERSAAKSAYKAALGDFEEDEHSDRNLGSRPIMQQITVLVLLGRIDEARSALDRGRSKFPDDPGLRGYAENKEIERMKADPNLRDISL